MFSDVQKFVFCNDLLLLQTSELSANESHQ